MRDKLLDVFIYAIIPLILIGLLAALIPLTVREGHNTKIVAYTYSGTIAIPTEKEYVTFKQRVAQYNISLDDFQVLNTGYPILVHFGTGVNELYFFSPNAPELFPYGDPKPSTQHLGGFALYMIADIVIVALLLSYVLIMTLGIPFPR